MIESLNECLDLEKELKLEDNFREHDEWDSMFKLVLLTCLDENFNIKISPNELEKYSTIKEISIKYIKK